MMRAWAVGLRLDLAHGSILTLANCIYHQLISYTYLVQTQHQSNQLITSMLTVGMAVATLATTAALAPAMTPSAILAQIEACN